MSIRESWQLVAHSPKALSPAHRCVADAIARRIIPGNLTQPIPQRTLLAESGVKSKDTVQKALAALQVLGVITVKSRIGSRQADLITWLLECPQNCELDHSNANRRTKSERATRPTVQDMTRPTVQDALRSNKKERKGFLDFIQDSLELSNKTGDHVALSEALQNTSQRGLVLVKAEALANKGTNPEAYLKAIVRDNPRHLLPDPPKRKPELDYSHLPPEIAAIYRRLDIAREAAL